jgi:hypothetical protein
MLDLPEALLCSQTWLNQVFPGDVVNYSESRDGDLDRQMLLKRPIWCLSPSDIERIHPDTADVFINIYSFAEMPHGSVENYYNQLQRITRRLFYTKQRKLENNISDGVAMSVDTYPRLMNSRQLWQRPTTLYEEMFEAAYCFDGKVSIDPR